MQGSGVFLGARSFRSGLWSTVSELIHRKWYLIGLALLATGGYGFRLSHPVSGIDDICAGLYFVDGLVAIIGRWPLFLLGQLFPIGHYAPFLMDLLGVFLMAAAAILWCALLQHILGRPLSTGACLVFSGAFVNFALNSEVFIYYLHNGAGLGSCLIPLSLYLVYSDRRLDLKSGKKRHVLLTIGATALLTVAIGLYESFASVFLTGLCLIMLADGLSLDRMQATKWRRTALSLCYSARLMVYAMVFRSAITQILRGLIPLDYSYYRSPLSVSWLFQPGAGAQLHKLWESFLRQYLYPGLASPSLFLVLVALVGFLLVGIIGTARKKRTTFLLWAVGACLSPFALSLISGQLQMQRSCQALPLFAGAALLGGWLLAERWKNQWTKCAVAALIAVVLLNVTIEIHGFFSGNYSLRMSEYRILDRVAADLQRDYPLTEKPVLFVGSPNARYYVLEPGLLITQDRLGYSVASALLGIEDSAISVAQSPAIKLIPWAEQAFPGIYGVNGCLPQIFAQQGCPVLRGTAAQYTAAKEIAETMPEYPKAGYIKEMETFIIVHFGEG